MIFCSCVHQKNINIFCDGNIKKEQVTDMKKLLIVLPSRKDQKEITDELGKVFQIAVCEDGREALKLLESFRPDVMVLDMLIPRLDGLTLLRIASQTLPMPRVIAVSEYISGYMSQSLAELGIACLIRQPDDNRILAAQIYDVAAWTPGTEQKTCRDIQRTLAVLGFKRGTAGYNLTVMALVRYREAPHQLLMDSLYPDVGKMLGSTASQVEKAIRDGITSAWKHRDPAIWDMYFPNDQRKPTNAEFLATITECLNAQEPSELPAQKLG